MSVDQLTACLNITRRLPHYKIEKTLCGLVTLVPAVDDDLVQRVDRPLSIQLDEKKQMWFVLCEYNKEAESFRSPWSNEYYPKPPNDNPGYQPAEHLRKLEVQWNAVFDAYRAAYYEGGVSSVYLWDLGEAAGFAAAFVIHKAVEQEKLVETGIWDSIHVVEIMVQESTAKNVTIQQATYKLTSTVIVDMQMKTDAGMMHLSGALTRQRDETHRLTENNQHLQFVGHMIEAMENEIRTHLNVLYINKTREVTNGLRYIWPLKTAEDSASSNAATGIGQGGGISAVAADCAANAAKLARQYNILNKLQKKIK
eukprot:Platyproteum_vivax@DN4799_c0_g1_i1.p1